MRTLAVAVILALAAGTGCDDGAANANGKRAVGAEKLEAAVYAVVVSWFAEREPPTDGEEIDTVFLDSPGDDVSLEVQVELIQEFGDDLAVRFIDADEEAIEMDAEGAPVRTGAFLLRLGSLVIREDRAEVDVERYDGDGKATRYRFVVESSDDSWSVVGEPEVLPPLDEPT